MKQQTINKINVAALIVVSLASFYIGKANADDIPCNANIVAIGANKSPVLTGETKLTVTSKNGAVVYSSIKRQVNLGSEGVKAGAYRVEFNHNGVVRSREIVCNATPSTIAINVE